MTRSSCATKALALALAFVPLLLSNVSSGADELVFEEMDSKEQLVQVTTMTSRTLMDDHGFLPPHVGLRMEDQMVFLDDYDPVDPVPSSKTSVKHGPIQHSTPLIPHLPKPSPPNYPPSP